MGKRQNIHKQNRENRITFKITTAETMKKDGSSDKR